MYELSSIVIPVTNQIISKYILRNKYQTPNYTIHFMSFDLHKKATWKQRIYDSTTYLTKKSRLKRLGH